jgi:predicted aminopeptidase
MLPIHQFAVSNLRRGLAPVITALALTALAGCADLGYLMQSANGHLTLMRAAKPIDDWQRDPEASPELKARLALAQKIRRFAATDLALPDNASYTRYADLKRRAVVWNASATAATFMRKRPRRWRLNSNRRAWR